MCNASFINLITKHAFRLICDSKLHIIVHVKVNGCLFLCVRLATH